MEKYTHHATTICHDMVRCRSIDCGNYDRYLSGPLRTYTGSLCHHTGAHHWRYITFGAGLIGGRLQQGSMNTTAFSFGH